MSGATKCNLKISTSVNTHGPRLMPNGMAWKKKISSLWKKARNLKSRMNCDVVKGIRESIELKHAFWNAVSDFCHF